VPISTGSITVKYSGWEADLDCKPASIPAFTKQARLLSGQANKILMLQPLHGFKFLTTVKLFFGKENTIAV